jgi:hypothetical protein
VGIACLFEVAGCAQAPIPVYKRTLPYQPVSHNQASLGEETLDH